MSWISAVPAVFAAATILFVPGIVVALFIGLRGLWATALAPLISATMISAASLALPLAGIPWTPLTALAFCIIFGAIIVVLFRGILRAEFVHENRGLGWATGAGALLGTIPLTAWLTFGIGDASGISQTFDNIFHLNILRFIDETQNASAMDVGLLTSGGFYPDGWHVFVSLTAAVSGVDLGVAANGFNLVAAATIWPLGIMLLTRQFVRKLPLAMVISGSLSAAMVAFPLNLLDYGVLYPYFLGLLMVPALLSTVLQLLKVTLDEPITSTVPLAVLVAGLIPGTALAHPAAMMTVLALSVSPVIVATFTGLTGRTRREMTLRLAGFSIFLAVGLIMLLLVRPDESGVWGPRMSTANAAWQSVSLEIFGFGTPYLLAALTLAGLVYLLRDKRPISIALVGVWLIAILLFFVSAGVPFWRVRYLLTGVWYGDAPRLAAIVPIVVVPVATAGLIWFLGLPIFRKVGRGVILASALVTLLIVQLTAGYPQLAHHLRGTHTPTDTSALLSTDEIKLLEQLRELIPEDSLIAGNPWTGTSLAYAYSGIEVVLPHIFVTPTPDEARVLYHLHSWKTDPGVCQALEDSSIDYVLDFGEREVHGARHKYAGIEDLVDQGLGKVIAEEGDARLLEITACKQL